MQRIQAIEQVPGLFVDSGNLLFPRRILAASQEQQARITALGIAQAMQAMSCGAVGIGGHDLALGVEFLRQLHSSTGIPWVSMNLVERQSKQPVFAPFRLVELAGLSVAVLGLSDEGIRLEQAEEQEKYALLPWQETLPQVLAQVQDKADLIILLSSYPMTKNKELVAAVEGIHLLLAAGHAVSITAPFMVENTLFAQTENQGKYLGVLHIHWPEEKSWLAEAKRNYSHRFVALARSLPENPKVRELVETMQQRLRELR